MDKTMKFISWNVNGLRACMQKGFLDFFNEVDADFFCVQETKLQVHIRNGHILVVRAKTDGVLILFLSFHRGDCPDDKKDK